MVRSNERGKIKRKRYSAPHPSLPTFQYITREKEEEACKECLRGGPVGFEVCVKNCGSLKRGLQQCWLVAAVHVRVVGLIEETQDKPS